MFPVDGCHRLLHLTLGHLFLKAVQKLVSAGKLDLEMLTVQKTQGIADMVAPEPGTGRKNHGIALADLDPLQRYGNGIGRRCTGVIQLFNRYKLEKGTIERRQPHGRLSMHLKAHERLG